MKKATSLFSIIALFFCAAAWQPHSGLASDKRLRVKVTVKTTGGPGESYSVLWVRNLSPRNATVGLNDASSVHESPYVSDPIAGGATMRFAEQLPVTLRRGGDLIVRSDEQVAAILSNQGLPVDRSEFFLRGQQEVAKPGDAPRWVTNLEIVGESGSNLLKTGSSGYAPVVKGESDFNKRYDISVALSLTRRNSSVQVNLFDSNNKVIRSAVLSGSVALYSRLVLGEFISGNPDFPVRLEMNVLAGKAQGFLSIKDLESLEETPIPIVLRDQKAKGIHLAGGGAYGGGIAYFSNGILDCAGSSYTYNVVDAPPNVCGALNIIRNGNYEVTNGWICTDHLGRATKGPWTVSTNQTGSNIYIRWPDGTRTSGGEDKIDDLSPPNIYPNSGPPSSFSGAAYDVTWGSGFGAATDVLGYFRNNTTGKYWDGSGYNSYPVVYFPGNFSVTDQWSATWSFTSSNRPPLSAHVTWNSYTWYASIDDRCNQRSTDAGYSFTY